MTATLHILADDLTGALDSAAAFAVEVPVYLDAPTSARYATGAGVAAASGAPGGLVPAAAQAPNVAAVAVATRDVDAAALEDLLAPSIPWLVRADIAFKKVDSLLRGNTFAECAHVARAGGFDRVVFAPAYPQQGRLMVAGRALVQQPGAVGSTHGSTPIGDRTIAEAFAGVAGFDLPLAVPDVRSDADLLRIAQQAVERPAQPGERVLWCGSAGLAQALAAVLDLRARPSTTAARAAPLLLISASHHPVVREQWARLAAAGLPAVLSTRAAGEATAQDRRSPQAPLPFDAALQAIGAGFDLALLDLSPAERLSAAQAAALLAGQLDAIVQCAPRPQTLLVVGGDTLRALCRASGAHALLAGAAAREGWGCARLVGGRWDGTVCHSRSGAFGPPEDLLEMCRPRA